MGRAVSYFSYNKYFWDAVISNSFYRLGEALNDTKKDNIGLAQTNVCARDAHYKLNFFGDPATELNFPRIPYPANKCDYDGDGTSDFGVFQPFNASGPSWQAKDLLNNKVIISYLLLYVVCMILTCPYVYATPTPSPFPSPSPVTHNLTIKFFEEDKFFTFCLQCGSDFYEIYIDGTTPEHSLGYFYGWDLSTTLSLTEGFHEIYIEQIMSYNGGEVFFWHWEDGSTEKWPRSIDIQEDTLWTIYRYYVPCYGFPRVDVCINEIAWMGTEADADCKWIELYNAEEVPIGLGGFRLKGNNMDISLGGIIMPGDYYLIESDENCVSDIAGDIVNTDLSLFLEGDYLSLYSHDYLLDEVDCSSGWFAGNENYYYSMERKYSHIDCGNERNNWADWNGSTWSGRDANGDPLNATVKKINTVYYPSWPPPTPTPILDGGDYNGDGTADIAIFRESSGLWAIRNLTWAYFGSSLDTPVPGDYDGDGTADIGIFRPSTGLWAIRDVSRAYFGSSGDTPVPLRFNSSSACNIGIFRESTGLWAIKDATRVYFGKTGDIPVPGDYNGGRTKDLGIFRESSGLWALREVSRFYFGQSADTAIPGNYGGDGIYSAAVFRGSSGLWAIRGISRICYGTSGDWVVPADYLGDGTTAIGIFRENSGLWAVRGVTRIYYGTTGDIPVPR